MKSARAAEYTQEQKRSIAAEVREHLRTKGILRKQLLKPGLGKTTIDKFFTGDFTADTLQRLEGALGRKFSQRSGEAPLDFGGYTSRTVEELLGQYLCLRPRFDDPRKLKSYTIKISWDENKNCLVFQEGGREDAKYAQAGDIRIPSGHSFMNLLTMEEGSVRNILVTFPDEEGICRGLITTFYKAKPTWLVPACAPFVMKHVDGSAENFDAHVDPGYELYDEYQALVASVTADYAVMIGANVLAPEQS